MSSHNWLYLYLFYSELFIRWNNKMAFEYMEVIILVYTAAIACLLATMCCHPSKGPVRKDLAQYIVLLLGLWMPTCVCKIPQYGCCAQGVVFLNFHLQGMQDLLQEPPYRLPGNMITEDYTKDKGLVKWALDPSIIQHVGLVESSEGPRRAEVWDFSFERLSAG